ncbi:hypothetical protein [Proteiniphilum sp. X52]|uniref:hypothetical protein n=1 Tax=Proteiniphilum sp. X52 TaxID=2382159 RepID=UPI001C88A94F|nr:hypothetical protein [Proteiniphilum sp. X52]
MINPFIRTLISSIIGSFLLIACSGERSGSKTLSGSDRIPFEENDEQPADTRSREEPETVDEMEYRQRLLYNANGDTTGLWPVQDQPLPLKGAILPYRRVVAYYGNLFSKNMGILGEYPPQEVWRRLNEEVKAWEHVDPDTPVQPAIHYIAVVAQGSPWSDGKYRYRMPEAQIDSALAIAEMGNAILFLDIQVALSTVEEEVPLLERYLKMPHVHLGVDPEFSMKDGTPPGKKIGTYDAGDINFCTEYLAKLVREYDLPPKILVVHRFTRGMVTNYQDIVLRPEVQIVVDMDGWGGPQLKYDTYRQYLYKEPVQFTGFKLFYKNDVKHPPHRMLTPPEIMKLTPHPLYIQYQ